MPKVSIVMPNYNGGKYLEKAIGSVLDQTFMDFELIVVDDASTDNSYEIIESFRDVRIKKIFNKKNRHVAYTANIGLEQSSGKYIARMDSDDVWAKDKLEKQVDYMEKHSEIGACFTRVHLLDDDSKIADEMHPQIYDMFNNAQNRPQAEWVKFLFFNGNCLCNPSGLVRTEALDTIGRLHNLAYVPGQDFETWSRLVLKYPIYILDDKLTFYRWTEKEGKISSMNSKGVSAFQNVHMLMRSNYLDLMNRDEFIRNFSDIFINSNSMEDIELECEKAFILEKCAEKTTGKINFFAIQKIEKILNMPRGLDVLENQFGFDLKKYYMEYRNRNFFDYNTEIELQKFRQQEMMQMKSIHDKEIQNEHLQNEMAVLTNLCKQKEEEMSHVKKELSAEKEKAVSITGELNSIKEKLEIREMEFQKTQNDCCKVQEELNAIKNSLIWKMTEPFRYIMNKIK